MKSLLSITSVFLCLSQPVLSSVPSEDEVLKEIRKIAQNTANIECIDTNGYQWVGDSSSVLSSWSLSDVIKVRWIGRDNRNRFFALAPAYQLLGEEDKELAILYLRNFNPPNREYEE